MNFENVNIYDWTSFNIELSQQLVKIGKNTQTRNNVLREKCISIFGDDDSIYKYAEIDPFSFFYYLAQRNSTNKRQRTYGAVKSVFNIQSPIPTDLTFPTPVPNAITLFHDSINYYTDLLWKVFIDVVEIGIVADQDFIDVLAIRAVAIAKFSQTLFLINPIKFIPIDNTIKSLKINLGVVNNYTEYSSAINQLKSLFKGCELYEINLLAVLLKENNFSIHKKYFQVSSNAYNDGDLLTSFFEKNGVWTGGEASSQDGYKYPVTEPKVGDIMIIRTGSTKVRAIGIVVLNTYVNDGHWTEKGMIKIIRLTVEDKEIDHQFTRKEALNRINTQKENVLRKQYKELFNWLDSHTSNIHEFDIKKENSMEFTKNIILYGPPGTGKTYHTIDLAVSLCEATDDNGKDHDTNKNAFQELKKAGQIEFITFHQNYSYEDFMIGLRPYTEGVELAFKEHKGIFYELSKRAEENYLSSLENGFSKEPAFEDVFETFLYRLIDEENEIEVKMKSDNHSFHITGVSKDGKRLHFRKKSGGTGHDLTLNNIKNIYEGDNSRSKVGLGTYYYPLNEALKEVAKQQTHIINTPLKQYVLIIDEINRANISRVFGELITLLEDDKRIGQPNELPITLPNGEKEFGIPPNLHIVGTMNTADKSIALVDIALRRRFEFRGKYPIYVAEGNYTQDKADLLKKLNEHIYTAKKTADFLIGHAYFMKDETIENVIKHKIIPLLMEYFNNRTEEVQKIFNGTKYLIKYNTDSYDWDILPQNDEA